MVSFIIFSRNHQQAQEYVVQQCQQKQISTFDHIVIKRDSEEKTTQSIGIDAIKRSQKKMYLMPVQSKEKAIIIHEAETLTTEAQNALLKVLEEPPQKTTIYLLTSNIEAILPTIRSRCSLVTLEAQATSLQTSENVESIQSLSLSAKLALAERHAKQKTLAQQWLEQLLIAFHNSLHVQHASSSHLQRTIHSLTIIQQTLQEIQTTNVNLRLALEKVILSL